MPERQTVIDRLTVLAEVVLTAGHPSSFQLLQAVGVADLADALFQPHGPVLTEFIVLSEAIVESQAELWQHAEHSDRWKMAADMEMSTGIGLTQIFVPLLDELHAAAGLPRPALTAALAKAAEPDRLRSALLEASSPAEAEAAANELDLRELHHMALPKRPH